MNHVKPKSETEFIKSGRSGFYSAPHDAYFFDGETPPLVPMPVADVKSTRKKADKTPSVPAEAVTATPEA